MQDVSGEIYYAVADRPDEQVLGFENRYEYISETQIREVFSHNWYKVRSMEKSKSWGTAHLVYFVETLKDWEASTLVFRANGWEKWWFKTPEISMLSEKIITDAVRVLWVSTNTILAVDISRKYFSFDYQIEEVLEWEDPERYLDDNGRFLDRRSDYDKMSFELGQTIAKYSDLEFQGFGIFDNEAILEWKIQWTKNTFYEYITTNLDFHLQALVWYWVIDNQKKWEIIQIFERYKNIINDCKSSLVHHDLADHNIMYDPIKKWLGWIFDWEAMVLWDPMLDLWSCPTWGTHCPRRELLIEGYSSVKNLPDDYELRMDLYELRTWIWKVMFIIRMNFWDKIRDEMLEKMDRVLARLWEYN